MLLRIESVVVGSDAFILCFSGSVESRFVPHGDQLETWGRAALHSSYAAGLSSINWKEPSLATSTTCAIHGLKAVVMA